MVTIKCQERTAEVENNKYSGLRASVAIIVSVVPRNSGRTLSECQEALASLMQESGAPNGFTKKYVGRGLHDGGGAKRIEKKMIWERRGGRLSGTPQLEP